jgi:hypothetical protein
LRDQWNGAPGNPFVYGQFTNQFTNQFPRNVTNQFNAGDNVGFALDANAWLLWWRVNGGAWQPGGDPAVASGGWAIPVQLQALSTGGVAPAIVLFDTSDAVTGKFSTVSWTYTAPSGFGVM